jgi:hypothetical protein
MTNSSERIKELYSKALGTTDPAQVDRVMNELKAALREKLLHEQRWMALCERAAVERDPKKLLQLVSEINRLLDARIEHAATPPDGSPSTHVR